MSRTTRNTGILGEELACQALASRGYRIIERNWRCASGEIDIVAQDRAAWVFVEVKTRHGHTFGMPEDAINPAKTERLVDLAELYLAEKKVDAVCWRVDLVAVELDRSGRVRRLDIIPDIGADI